MWVVYYDRESILVYKIFTSKKSAIEFQTWKRSKLYADVYKECVKVDKFETGKLDSWLTFKMLSK